MQMERRGNRSMPASTVIPELAYPDVPAAVDWLCRAFGFALRLRIGDHRAQLSFGDGAIVVVAERGARVQAAGAAASRHAVMLRVPDLARHHARALAAGA